jgi:hypothetical protein
MCGLPDGALTATELVAYLKWCRWMRALAR